MGTEAEWFFYIGVGLFTLIGLMQTAKVVLERIAVKKGPENTVADEWAGYLGIGTEGLRALANALGLEVKSNEPKEVTAKKVKAEVDKRK